MKIIAVCFSLFQLYTAMFGVFEAQIQRPTHLMFALTLIYLLHPTQRKRQAKRGMQIHPLDIALSLLSIALASYSLLNYENLMESAGLYSTTDFIMAVLGILLTLEATRRIVGLPIVIIAACFLAYAYLGSYFPGFLSHRGYELKRIVTHMWFTTEGIIGIPLGVSATFIFLFILFGAFLNSTGIWISSSTLPMPSPAGPSGGPAKVAVITSALEGTVSGSSVANTVGSGSFTIPMMKKLGYRPEFAGAVEAAASTGGQIMPPVMGAAAFLMAEFINMPYVEIAKAAAIPACLYFTGIWIGGPFRGQKVRPERAVPGQLPNLWHVLKEDSYLILPLIAIIYLLVEGFTPMRAALVGLGSLHRGRHVPQGHPDESPETSRYPGSGRPGRPGRGHGLRHGGHHRRRRHPDRASVSRWATASWTSPAGILILTLIFTMITSLILGMGVPTTANYVITSTMRGARPSSLSAFPILAAHMFVFYFGIIADITPPVALAAFAGAAIAKANPIKTGIDSHQARHRRLHHPLHLCLQSGDAPDRHDPLWKSIQIIITAIIGMIGIGAAWRGGTGPGCPGGRGSVMLAAGLLLIIPGLVTDLIGLGLMALITVIQYYRTRTAKTVTTISDH